jgi:hypothetical protein
LVPHEIKTSSTVHKTNRIHNTNTTFSHLIMLFDNLLHGTAYDIAPASKQRRSKKSVIAPTTMIDDNHRSELSSHSRSATTRSATCSVSSKDKVLFDRLPRGTAYDIAP